MAVGDVGSLVDLATSSTAAPSGVTATEDSAVESTVVNNGTDANAGEVDSTQSGAETDDGGKEKGTQQNAEADKAGGAEKTPAEVRNLLKQIREGADPNTEEGKGAIAAAKQLHQAFEREREYRTAFGNVAAARNAAAFIKEIGGREGWVATQQTIQSIQESDALLYAGDPKLLDHIIEDLKSEGKIEAFGQLAPAFLDKLRAVDNAAYYKAFAPHFFASLQECEVPHAINNLDRALASNNIAEARQILHGMAKWYNGIASKIEHFNRIDPERERFKQEKVAWESSKVKERNAAIATEAESFNNRELGKQLATYLKMPFFKGFPRETLVVIGNELKNNLFNDLKADRVYQTQMKALWGAKSPDKGKIVEYHQAAVQSRAERVVRDVIQRLYPGYARGGAAAGRVAAAAQKRGAEQQTAATASAQGKPVYILNKPAWNQIDWSKDPKQLNYIAGRAWLKTGKFVTWRKAN
jgi:hypothetical protein